MARDDCHVMLPTTKQNGVEQALGLATRMEDSSVAHEAIGWLVKYLALKKEQAIAIWADTKTRQRRSTGLNSEIARNADTPVAVNT